MTAGRRLMGHGAVLLALAAGCQPLEPPNITACDSRQNACQQQLAQGVEQLRGRLWDPWWPRPEVVIITPDEQRQIAALIARDLRRAAASGIWSEALQQVGLLGVSLDVATADQAWFETALAAYWPAAKAVTVVDRGQALDDVRAAEVLSHELVHAFQDRELNFAGFSPLSTDQEMVRMALTEGEAVVYAKVAEQHMRGEDPAAFDWNGYFGDWMAALRAQTAEVRSAHSHIRLSFPYPVGGAFLAQAWQSQGVIGVDRHFLHPPRSFLELLLANEGAPAPAPSGPVDCTEPRVLSFGGVVSSDTLGAGLLYGHLVNVFEQEVDAWAAALTWRGDRLWLMFDANRRPVTFWRVHAPGIGATALGPALAGRTDPPVLEGDELVFWSGTSSDALAEMRARLTCRWP
jgi:hypothetical protein